MQVEPIQVVSDSLLPTAGDYDETQALCSPSQLLNTSSAIETLRHQDTHDESVKAQAQLIGPFATWL